MRSVFDVHRVPSECRRMHYVRTGRLLGGPYSIASALHVPCVRITLLLMVGITAIN